MSSPRSHFGDQFARCETDLAAGSPHWLAAIRRTAIDRFDELGLPTRKDEAWKYTPTGPIDKAGFASTTAAGSNRETQISREDIVRIFGEPSADCRLVFENGHFAPDLSAAAALPESVVAKSLANLLRDEPEVLEQALLSETDTLARPFAALNLAFIRDGAFVSIGASSVRHAVELLFVTTQHAAGCVSNVRNIIRVAAGASAVVSMRYASDSLPSSVSSPVSSPAASSDNYLTNAVTTIELGENAELDLVTVQQEAEDAYHLSSVDVEQRRDSRFRSHLFSLGASLARSEVNAVLADTGADCTLNGLFLGAGTQHHDNQTTIDHATPHGTSRELYKGILGGRSRGVFNGMVRVRPDAQQTNAQQSNPNLLVSDRAQINTKPTLEIYADDVKCAHGSTIGRLDEDALFYLRARGVDERAATEILVGAFASEVTNALPDEALRADVQLRVTRKLSSVSGGGTA